MQAHSSHAAPRSGTVQNHPPRTGTAAERALADAILHAGKDDILARIDHAISMGAQLNHPDVYERNALVMAVRANRHDILPALTLRGAMAPFVPADGVDLLMEACRRGNEAMAKALVDAVGFTTSYTDEQGRSALHFAVLSGSASLVRYLLSLGADPDNVTLVLDATENGRIFGNAYALTAKAVTPLMMALGLGYDAIASALLDAGADPNAGGCSPLILAACHDRRAVFAELLARGATLKHCKNWQGNEALDACIYARMPAAFLAQLLHMHDFTKDDGSLNSPLGSAVSLQDADVVASLLAFGAPVENHRPESRFPSLWEQALPPRQSTSAVLDLLTASRVAVITVGDMRSTEDLLHRITDHIDAPELLASLGIFTSLLPAASNALRQMARQPWLHSRQRAPQIAMTLVQTLPDLPPPPHGPWPHQLPRHESWKHRTALERYRQCTSLRQAANHLIGQCVGHLKASTQPAFFVTCTAGCPDHMPLSLYMTNQIAALSGAPDPVISLVRHAWISAVALEGEWNVAPGNPDGRRRLLSALARNLLHKALDDDEIESTPLIDLCLNAIRDALSSETHALGQFCSGPAAWLSDFEARYGSAGSGRDAVHELQMSLALPRSVCDQVWQLWRQSVRQTGAQAQPGSNEALAALKRQLALQLPQIVFNGRTRNIVPPGAQVKLLNWRVNVLTPPNETTASRKRPAEFEAQGGPPRKEPKN